MTGCALVALGLVALFLAFASWFAVAAVAAFVGFIVYQLARSRSKFAAGVKEFRRRYPDKHLLVVYTDSPVWKPVIEHEWTERWGSEMATFNRSRPWKAASVEARIWSACYGRQHTPLAVVMPANGKAHVVRLFHAFRDYKHGKVTPLRDAERRIDELLAQR